MKGRKDGKRRAEERGRTGRGASVDLAHIPVLTYDTVHDVCVCVCVCVCGRHAG